MPSHGPPDLVDRPSAGAPSEEIESLVADPEPSDDRDAFERSSAFASVAVAAAVFLLIQLYAIGRRAPLGHDESVYLLRARYYAGNTPPGGAAGYWTSYRAPGLPGILSVPMRIVGESVSVSRLVVALFGVGTVVLTAFVAGRLGGPRAAIVAPWAVVVAAAFTSYSHVVLLDVPGAFFGVLAGAVMLASIRDDEVRWWPALLIPVIVMAGTYVRYGTITNIGAILVAIVIARADVLLRTARRWRNIVRIGAVAALSGVTAYLVLMVPAFTGARDAPYEAQRAFRDAKGLSPWASYGDLADLVWPNGSRADEVFNWFTLALMAIGAVLTVVALVRGSRRRAAIVGLLSTALWVIGLNIGLGQLFGNYLGLGVPFLALLVAPGYAYALDVASTQQIGRTAALAVGALAVVIGSASVVTATSDRVDELERQEVLRATGAQINAISSDQQCAVISSYLQVAWYADCLLRVWGGLEPGNYLIDEVGDRGAFPRDSVDPGQIHLVLAENGKRQPSGEALDRYLADSELSFTIEGRPNIDVRRVVAPDG